MHRGRQVEVIMLSVGERDAVSAAVHRALFVHFNGRPAETFDVEKLRFLIADDGIAATTDLAREVEIAALVLDTIEDQIIFLWRNGASHTFLRVNAPDGPPAWRYAHT
jgi:hypothetical protein